MNKREAAIVSAYTGYLIGDFGDMHQYVEKLLGRPIWTHEFPDVKEEMKAKAKPDFIGIEII